MLKGFLKKGVVPIKFLNHGMLHKNSPVTLLYLCPPKPNDGPLRLSSNLVMFESKHFL